MAERRLGIIVNGATGGLARSQHIPALLAIRRDGGLALDNGDCVMPDLLLVGRDPARLQALADATGTGAWTTVLDEALASETHSVFFDASATGVRYRAVSRAIEAGKHIYCEKPIACTVEQAMALVRGAEQRGLKNGTVQDKLHLPGPQKLRLLKEAGFFGRVLEVRLEFGRWVFDGNGQPAQRPSWNYRRADGGGLVLDMFPHWRYLIENLVADVRSVSCVCRTHLSRRWDEQGHAYDADAEDATFAQMELEGGAIASVNSSWCTRIRRDDILTIQVDGTNGSAAAGTFECHTQPAVNTPRPVITVDAPQPMDFRSHWLRMPDGLGYTNSYRIGWEQFLRHVLGECASPAPLIEGAKGVQLAELAYRSHRERRWIEVPELT